MRCRVCGGLLESRVTDLLSDRQVARVTEWATVQQIPIDKVVVGVASALDVHRRKFVADLCEASVHRIVVEHRDGSAGSVRDTCGVRRDGEV